MEQLNHKICFYFQLIKLDILEIIEESLDLNRIHLLHLRLLYKEKAIFSLEFLLYTLNQDHKPIVTRNDTKLDPFRRKEN